MTTSSDSTILAIASKGPVDSFEEVSVRLRALDAAFDASDGLYWFNRLYGATLAAVLEAGRKHRFADLRFVERLECHLANLYFVALAAHLSDPGTGACAWEPLFLARTRPSVSRVQFALAGLNAQLNRDLPVALVSAFIELDCEPGRETPCHTDYQQAGAQIEATLRGTRSWLHESLSAAEIEHEQAELETLLAVWSPRRARDAGWIAAEVRWALRGSPLVARHQLEALDRMVELAGHGLLLAGSAPAPRSRPALSR